MLRTFATMTTEVNLKLALIQEPMPVIIERTDWTVLSGEAEDDSHGLMHPRPFGRFRIWPVSRAVNSVKNDGSELLEPHDAAADEPGLL